MKHFTIITEEEFSSIGSKITLLEHRETKARVCFIQNKEENKVFSITFKTPPLSDNGVAHILEHCVLNGSKKYPLKDPFIQLSKNSLNTFLNAMTFPDKTMYPVASCNLKDFHNLTDVYLDAVFHPNIYHNPFIFEQEGWHYELFNEEDDITFKGVVFNEMKGAFSTPEDLLHRNIQSALFPNHPYGFDSGGIPENIPELSYEEFIEFHRSHYHPSNSYIYFYGDLDMETELSRLQEYLKEFQYQKPNSDIPPVSKWTEPKEYPMQYPVLDGDSGEEQGYLSLNYAFPFLSIEEKMAMSILAYLLLDAPGAILKERLVNAGMGEEVYGFFSSEIREYTFTIIAKNINIEKKESFLELVKSTLKEVIKEGLDKEKVLAAVNYFEFRLREADFGSYPKGIIYNMSILEYWIHDKDPLALFDYDKHLNAVREMASGGEIFQLLQTYLLDNPHCAYIIMTPSTSMLSEMEEKERLKLRRHKDSLDLKSIHALIERNRQLQQIQMTPDSPEVLAMLPSLELTDIEVDGKEVEYREEIVNTAKILHHTANTSGIIYAKMFFECNWLSEEELPLLSLITSYLTMVCSKNYHYSELSDLINRYTGGVGSSLSFYVNKDNCDDFRVGFELKGKAFISAFEKLLEILKEIIAMPKFEDAERLGILIKESASQMQAGLVSGGHITALTRVRSYYSGLASCEEKTNGIEFFEFVKQLKGYDNAKLTQLGQEMQNLLQRILHQSTITVALTYSEADKRKIAPIYSFLNDYANSPVLPAAARKSNGNRKEAFITSGNVNFVAKATNFKKLGYDYSGVFAVANQLLNNEYLWNRVRSEGGAYGGFSVLRRSGDMAMVSYRDPNISKTYDIFGDTALYFKNLALEREQIKNTIIGTISNFDQPMTPSMENSKMLSMYLTGLTYQDQKITRKEILNTGLKDLQNMQFIYSDFAKEDYLCALGTKKDIQNDAALFQTVLELNS